MQNVVVFSNNEATIQIIESIFSRADDIDYVISSCYENCLEKLADLAAGDVFIVDCCHNENNITEGLRFLFNVESQAWVLPIVSNAADFQIKSPFFDGIPYVVCVRDIEKALLQTIRFVAVQPILLLSDSGKQTVKTEDVSLPQIKRYCDNKKFSSRQIQVMYSVLKGLSNEQIGKELDISVGTVKAHLTIIFRKLNITSRSQIYSCLAGNTNHAQFNNAVAI